MPSRVEVGPGCENAKGPVTVDVSLASRTAQLLAKDGTVLAEMDVSPGVEGHPTPTGDFRVTEKLPLKRPNLYGQYVKTGTEEVGVARAWEHEGPPPEGKADRGIATEWVMGAPGEGGGREEGCCERGEPPGDGSYRV